MYLCIFMPAAAGISPALALKAAKKLPSRCLSGRWGSVSETEQDLQKWGDDAAERCRVMRTVFLADKGQGVKGPEDETESQHNVPNAPDAELTVLDLAALRLKMGFQ